MKIKFITVVAFLFLIISCQHIDYIVIDSKSDSCKVLELNPVFEQHHLTINDIIDTMQVITLETKSESILSHITLLKITGDYIIINDTYQNGNIAIFDINGKFIRRISYGNGPKEINAVYSFDVDEKYLYTLQLEKVNKYTLSGDFVESYPVLGLHNVYYFHSLKAIDNGFLLAIDPCNSGLDKYAVLHTNKHFKEKNFFVFEHSFVGYSGYDDFKALQNGVCFFPSMCNTVYHFDGKIFKPYYIFNYPKYANTFENNPDCSSSGLEFREKHCINGKFFADGRLFQNRNILFFTFLENGNVPIKVYLDTNSNKFRSGIFISKNDTPVWPLKFGVVVSTFDDYFVQTLPPDYYLTLPQGFEGADIEGKHLEKSVSQLQHISDEDKKKILNAKDDDNPLIIMYKLKGIE